MCVTVLEAKVVVALGRAAAAVGPRWWLPGPSACAQKRPYARGFIWASGGAGTCSCAV